MTPFSVLCGLCGLSQREVAELVKARLDSVKSWASGRRGCPGGVMEDLRLLAQRQERAAAVALAQIIAAGVEEVELGYAADDHEARALGWPCVGAQAGAFARIVAGAPAGVRVILVPRGSTVGSAAAADAHDTTLPRRVRSTR